MYKEQSEIENLLLTYPLSQLELVLADYIPGSSNYRIVLQSNEKKHIFIFRNCIEVHRTKRKKPINTIKFTELKSNSINLGITSKELEKRVPFIQQMRDLIQETEEQIHETRWEYVEYSKRAAEWNLRLPVTMHEVKVYANNHITDLVFQDIKVDQKPLQAPVFQSV